MNELALMPLRVLEIEPLTERISRYRLGPEAGGALPPAQPGAHIELVLADAVTPALHRAYSVVNPESNDHYEIAVQREDRGSGGSLRVHRLQVGSVVPVRAPANDFALVPQAARSVLIAGGIGITPILAMARHLAARRMPYRLEYLSRDIASAAYADAVKALENTRLWHDGGDPARAPDLPTLLGSYEPGAHAYVCGPRGLTAAVIDAASASGWPEDAVHYELFTGALAKDGDRPFRVVLAGSGASYEVGTAETILEVLERAGEPVLADCRRGECGVCMTRVVRGLPDHRDATLTQAERAAGGLICPCVSRSLSEELVLQL